MSGGERVAFSAGISFITVLLALMVAGAGQYWRDTHPVGSAASVEASPLPPPPPPLVLTEQCMETETYPTILCRYVDPRDGTVCYTARAGGHPNIGISCLPSVGGSISPVAE